MVAIQVTNAVGNRDVINNPNNSTNLVLHNNTTIAQGAVGDTSILKNWEAANTVVAPPPATVSPVAHIQPVAPRNPSDPDDLRNRRQRQAGGNGRGRHHRRQG